MTTPRQGVPRKRPVFDRYFPYRGPCAVCGGPDARHRMTDMLQEMHKAGDSAMVLARIYEVPIEAIRVALRVRL